MAERDEIGMELEKQKIRQGMDRMQKVNMHFVRDLLKGDLRPGAEPQAMIMGLLEVAGSEAYADLTPETLVYSLELLKFPPDLAERMATTTRELVGTEEEKVHNGRLADALEQYAANEAEPELDTYKEAA